jgi:heme-degrading monooxygenase HmoA
MISRHWKGIARRGEAERYVSHLKRETFPGLAAIAGFVRTSILRREVEEGTEFQIVTVWKSWEAIRSFAGADPEEAVVPALVQAMMVPWDCRAAHYEVVGTGLPE